jgi:hypothetical protein
MPAPDLIIAPGRIIAGARLNFERADRRSTSLGCCRLWDHLLNLQRESGIHQSRPAIYGDQLAGENPYKALPCLVY